MKFLYFTDTHIRGNNPSNRKDNFPESLKKKVEEIVILANSHKVDAMLHGGDFFDLPNPSLAVTASFMKVFQGIDIPLYAIAGNHDMFAYNPATLERTMLGFLAKLGFLILIQPGDPVTFNNGNITVQISGQHFHYDIDRRDPVLDYAVKKIKCDIAVHMVHGMLLSRELFPGMRHTLIEKVALHTEADYTLSGHAHLGYDDVTIDGKTFINPGAVSRLSALEAEITRSPKVVLLDFSGKMPQVTKIPLQSAGPGNEVLDRAQIELAAFKEEKLNQFVQKVKASGEFMVSRLDEIIEKMAEREGLSPKVREEALNRLAVVQSRLGG